MHVGWTMRFDGEPPSLAQLRRHLEARLHLVPKFRRRVVRPRLGAAHWQDAPGFVIDSHVHAISAPAPGGPGELRDVAGALLSVPLALDMPLWRVFLVEGLQDGFALVGQAHHALVDGIAAMEVALLLFGPPPADGEHARWRPERSRRSLPSPGSAMELARGVPVRSAPAALRHSPGALRDAAVALEALSHRGTPTSLQANRTHRREVATAVAPLDGVKAAGRRHGATVNDVLLTACSIALGRALHRRGEAPADLKVLIPVNVRDAGAAGDLGNRISLVTVELPVGEPDALTALRRVRDRTRAVKAAGNAGPLDGLSRAADHLPGPLQRTLSRAISGATDYAAVISNVPGPPVELSVLGRPLKGMFPSVPVPDGRGLTIGCISYCGRLHVGLTADAEVVPDLLDVGRDVEAAFDTLRVEGPNAPTPWGARAGRRRGSVAARRPQRAASR